MTPDMTIYRTSLHVDVLRTKGQTNI